MRSLISADNSAKLIRLDVGQKLKPRARTNNSSLESGVWDKLITEVVSRLVVLWVLRGLRLRRLLVLPACVGAVGEGVGVLLLWSDVYFCLLPRCIPAFGTNNFWFYKQWKNICHLTARRHLILLTKECRRKMKHLRKELTFYKNRLAEHCNQETFSLYSTRIDSMALSLESLKDVLTKITSLTKHHAWPWWGRSKATSFSVKAVWILASEVSLKLKV